MDYNHSRPHSSLDYMAPAAFAAKCLEQGSATLRLTQDKENVCVYSHDNWYEEREQVMDWHRNSNLYIESMAQDSLVKHSLDG